MKLAIDESHYLSDITRDDKPAYLTHLAEKEIYDSTLSIPYPYTASDADWWIDHNLNATRAQGGRSVNWAIRRRNGQLIGGIGFLGLKIGVDHEAELGYWLAKPHWGRGVMTKCVCAAVDYAFRDLHVRRIAAKVFVFNLGSARVLEKAGFTHVKDLESQFEKDGRKIDGRVYEITSISHPPYRS